MVFDDLQDARTAKSPQRLGIGVLSATLRYVERVATSALLLPIQTTGLMLGDVVISILCLNEHKKQELLSGCLNHVPRFGGSSGGRWVGNFGPRVTRIAEAEFPHLIRNARRDVLWQKRSRDSEGIMSPLLYRLSCGPGGSFRRPDRV